MECNFPLTGTLGTQSFKRISRFRTLEQEKTFIATLIPGRFDEYRSSVLFTERPERKALRQLL
jgi:hypothetical protein